MQTVKDKGSLVAAIMGATIAYNQTEQQTPLTSLDIQTRLKVSRKLTEKTATRSKGTSQDG